MNPYLAVGIGLLFLGCLLLVAAGPRIRLGRSRQPRPAGRHHENTVEIVPPDYRPPTGQQRVTDDTERIEWN